jgi:hypothetical protein
MEVMRDGGTGADNQTDIQIGEDQSDRIQVFSIPQHHSTSCGEFPQHQGNNSSENRFRQERGSPVEPQEFGETSPRGGKRKEIVRALMGR